VPRHRWSHFKIVVVVCLALVCLTGARGDTPASSTLARLAGRAERVFRGRCLAAEIGTAEYAGTRIAATTYTFEVSEYLKGGGPGTLTFRQVGTPARELNDLGRVGGLPVYLPGTEYVIFLLPASRAGLTSPAGAARGVFLVSGDQAEGAAGLWTMPYQRLRSAVRQASQKPPGRP
jgi:hypothetical protein